jgi:hypothetical protein
MRQSTLRQVSCARCRKGARSPFRQPEGLYGYRLRHPGAGTCSHSGYRRRDPVQIQRAQLNGSSANPEQFDIEIGNAAKADCRVPKRKFWIIISRIQWGGALWRGRQESQQTRPAASLVRLHFCLRPCARSDGGSPYDRLAFDASGNLYGTAADGGTGCLPYSCGVIFEATP